MADDKPNLLAPDVARWPLDGGPVIQLEDVSKSFGDEVVLDGLDLDIEPGKITVILGASGSGKTVLVKHINGLLTPDSGSVKVFDIDISTLSSREIDEQVRRRVGTLFQEYALFDSMTVLDNVAFPLIENDAVSTDEAHRLSSELLEDLGLGDVLGEFPAALSGGMKKRVSLARTIITNPEVVLFDDPTTGLDPVMTEFVDRMILDISRKYQLTSVIVSHNIASIFRLADSIAVLHEGKIIQKGSREEIRDIDDERVRKFVDRLERTRLGEVAEPGEEEDVDEDDDEEFMVRLDGIHKSFSGREVLKGIDLVVPKRKITVLIGGSGAGKSVMIKHILGLMQPNKGTVTLFGENLSELSENELRELRTRIGMLFQHSALFDSMTVGENVAFPLVERAGLSRTKAREKTEEVLDRLKVSEIVDATPSEISSGQEKRVALARAIITEPKLMLYDEPTTGQDPIMADYVENMIVEAQEEFELTSIIISHDMASTFRIADQVALLHMGEIIAYGPPSEILESEDERVREFVYASQAQREDLEEAI